MQIAVCTLGVEVTLVVAPLAPALEEPNGGGARAIESATAI